MLALRVTRLASAVSDAIHHVLSTWQPQVLHVGISSQPVPVHVVWQVPRVRPTLSSAIGQSAGVQVITGTRSFETLTLIAQPPSDVMQWSVGAVASLHEARPKTGSDASVSAHRAKRVFMAVARALAHRPPAGRCSSR